MLIKRPADIPRRSLSTIFRLRMRSGSDAVQWQGVRGDVLTEVAGRSVWAGNQSGV